MFYLEKPSIEDKEAAINLIEKWFTFGGRINPGLLTEYQGNYETWLERLD